MGQTTRLSCTCVAVVLLGSAVFAAEEPRIRVDERANPWTHLDLRNDPDAFQFAIVTDRTGGHRTGVFPDAMRKLNLLQPEFVMSVGDLIEGGTENRQVLSQEWDEFSGFVEQLEMPFFYLPGNHDISNPTMAEVWVERFGRSYYHFVYHDVLFVGLNSEDTKLSNISIEQLGWLEKTLQQNKGVRWTLVFVHEPLWIYTDEDGSLSDTGWEQVESLLQVVATLCSPVTSTPTRSTCATTAAISSSPPPGAAVRWRVPCGDSSTM